MCCSLIPGHTQHSFPHALCNFCIFPSDESCILSMVFQMLCDAASCVISCCVMPLCDAAVWCRCVMLLCDAAVWCRCVMPLCDAASCVMLLCDAVEAYTHDNYATVDFMWTFEQCSEMYTLNIVVKYLVFIVHLCSPSFCCYTLRFSLPFQQSNCNQKGPASYSDVCWFNLHLHNHWHALICIRWTQSESRKISSRGTNFWGSKLRGSPLISKEMKCVLKFHWLTKLVASR